MSSTTNTSSAASAAPQNIAEAPPQLVAAPVRSISLFRGAASMYERVATVSGKQSIGIALSEWDAKVSPARAAPPSAAFRRAPPRSALSAIALTARPSPRPRPLHPHSLSRAARAGLARGRGSLRPRRY